MVAEVRVDACTTESVNIFIEECEDSSFENLNQLQEGDKGINGPHTKLNILRKCQHNVDSKYISKKSEQEISGKSAYC